jgi:16S rRNA (cytosine967-C5)-methyltransferase
VQDISSQSTGQYFLPGKEQEWLDCCSGAGGKSLLLKFIEPKINLSVSDTRETIVRNLKDRFKQYGMPAPATFIADARDKTALIKNFGTKKFDNIICDVPCTGSGTWARTPEQLYFSKEERITEYAERQKQIAANAIEFLKPDGRLIYITCSVFKAENEEVVDSLVQEKQVTILEKKLINGLSQKADCMFIAVLVKS